MAINSSIDLTTMIHLLGWGRQFIIMHVRAKLIRIGAKTILYQLMNQSGLEREGEDGGFDLVVSAVQETSMFIERKEIGPVQKKVRMY